MNTKLPRSQLRLLSLLPFSFFLAQAIHYWQINELGHMLWMCNIGNLMLAAGIYFEQAIMIRVAVMWALPGVIVWAIYVVPTWGLILSGRFSFSELFGVVASSLAHLGGVAVGVVVLRRFRMDGRTWLYAFVWYLIMQIISRLFTSAAMNVNLSHRVQDGFEQTFNSYWKFWIALTITVAVIAWLLGWVLKRIWPVHEI